MPAQIAAVLFGVVLTVGLAEGASRILFPHWRDFGIERFMKSVVVPGYGLVVIGNPGFKGFFAQNNGDFRVEIRINDAGLRNDRDVKAANGRVWVIGDSLAFGWGVSVGQTYTAVLEKKTGIPTYNVTSPGADVCGYQALAARMPDTVRPRAVIVGLVMENDVRRYDCAASATGPREAAQAPTIFPSSLLNLKRQLTESSALYNFAAVTVKRFPVVMEFFVELGLINRPHADQHAPARAEYDKLAKATASEVVRLRRIVGNIPFAVLIAPTRVEIRDDDPDYKDLRQRVDAALVARGIDVIDPFDRLRKAGMTATHFRHDGHWSPLGHRLAGEVAAEWLREHVTAGNSAVRP